MTSTSTQTRGRVALVTGGSGGIGRAVVERLARDGYDLVVHYAGNAERARAAVEAATGLGARAVAHPGDVADEQDMTTLFAAAEEAFGGVDVVVHTAGVMLLGPVLDYDLDDFDRMHRTNVRGAFVVAQLAARRLRSGGALITFSSSVTRLQMPTYAPYAASKAAVEGLTLILARELRGRDVTVNAVAPGPTATPLFLDGKSDEEIDGLRRAAPLERLGEPAGVAETVAFLAGPGRWVNGQVVFVDGGIG